MTAPAGGWIEVAAAVIERPDGAFLLAQRPEGKVYAGWWEFPGGKVEAGEDAREALVRELREELAIDVTAAYPWITRTHVYEHGRVRLNFFRVTGWTGEPVGLERQRFEWQRFPVLSAGPILPANGPILKALRLPLVMGVTQASMVGSDVFLQQLESALAAGLRLIQVREHQMTEAALHELARAVVERARPHGATVIVNGSPAIAAAAGADGVHLRASQLASLAGRPDLEWVGASCHSAAEIALACEAQVDYMVIGPLHRTPTHPGIEGIGWDGFRALSRGLPMPVFAIGGIAPGELMAARTAGAHGIAMIRGAWVGGD